MIRRKIKYRVGDVYARLTIISKSGSFSFCRCSCGNECRVTTSKLGRGHTKSCGCLASERSAQRFTKHGKHSHKVYRIWKGMISRCTLKSHPSYENYGGRGIAVCDEWRKFENFYHDMGERPGNLQLDRIDNSQGYCKDNCRWVSRKENCRNKTYNRSIEYQGTVTTLAELAETLGVSYAALATRIRLNWPVDRWADKVKVYRTKAKGATK